ncbi:sulfurtransferase [Rhodococcus sp. WMMA185]|uniref:rhodanese-like domain-containing protein n=1 Tax=Rhodococcus sp. WMMA185 TaxID=679318 RepID=UPI0008783F66|nr:rhodanese-like domain-containing protein [Rhodococcus sp. WMMA185]AOW95081.1 sulfurtransferase [Rhodococcus sp. WMMA185]
MHAVDLPGALARGAIVVDIRAQAQRVTEGTLPGALAIERDVLERRCNPLSSDHLALAVGHDVEWIIVCSDGYASSIAAAALQQLGLRKATSLVGGYRAIKTAGLLGSLIAAKHCVREMATVTAH